MTSCDCPDLVVDPIPTGPIRCGCCGEPLELTCAGKCDPSHHRAAIESAAPKRSASTHSARIYKQKTCACGMEFTPTGPRQVACPRCQSEGKDRG